MLVLQNLCSPCDHSDYLGGQATRTSMTTSRQNPLKSVSTSWFTNSLRSVVTVHGVCDDQQTAWTAERDNSDWIQYELFSGLSVRQLDYAYDNGYSARIYDPNSDGITVEANALLDSLAVNRLELPIVSVY